MKRDSHFYHKTQYIIQPVFNNDQCNVNWLYLSKYNTNTTQTHSNGERISWLTWQVSFRSAGEFPGVLGRFLLGRYFCPLTPVCWACFVAWQPATPSLACEEVCLQQCMHALKQRKPSLSALYAFVKAFFLFLSKNMQRHAVSEWSLPIPDPRTATNLLISTMDH